VILDIIIVTITLTSTLVGFVRGITREIFSVLSIFIGIIGASRGYQDVLPIVRSKIQNEVLASIISFVVLFLIIVILVSLVGTVLCRIWRILHLSIFDRIFGGIFGLLRALIVLGLIAIIIKSFPFTPIYKLTQNSILFPYVEILGDFLLFLFPFSFVER